MYSFYKIVMTIKNIAFDSYQCDEVLREIE